MRPNLPALTGLRFFAAAWIVFLHESPLSGVYMPYRVGIYLHLNPFQRFVTEGTLAVNFFFVLSGFILAYTYCTDEGTLRGSSHEFWFARFSRLWPMYMIGMALDAPFVLQSFAQSSHGVILFFARKLAIGALTALMLQSWISPIAGAWNAPGWSLSAEAFFYAMFPLLLRGLSRISSRSILLGLVPIWILSLPPTYIVASFIPAQNETAPIIQLHDIWVGFWSALPLLRLPEFAIGMMVGILFIRHRTQWSLMAAPALLPIFAMITLVAGVALTDPLFASIVVVPAFALLIFGVAMQRGILNKILSLPPIVLLGESSFCLYIIHWPVGKIVHEFEHGFAAGPPFNYQEHFLAYLVIVTSLSIFCCRYIERPICAWLRHRASKSHLFGNTKAVLLNGAAE